MTKTTRHFGLTSRCLAVLLGAFAVVAAGCGEDGVDRQNLSGTVTYQGKPVPMGNIIFEPDAKKGNRGPQGYSNVLDGAYSTDKYGKGAMTGPIKVTISGYPVDDNGKRIDEPLFAPFKTEIEITPETTTYDFEIPDSN